MINDRWFHDTQLKLLMSHSVICFVLRFISINEVIYYLKILLNYDLTINLIIEFSVKFICLVTGG